MLISKEDDAEVRKGEGIVKLVLVDCIGMEKRVGKAHRRTIKPRLAPVLFGEGMTEERAGDEREKLLSEASILTGASWWEEAQVWLAN